MRYLVLRARAILRHLLSLRGALLLAGIAGAAVALFAGGSAAVIGFVFFAIGIGGLLAIISVNQIELRRQRSEPPHVPASTATAAPYTAGNEIPRGEVSLRALRSVFLARRRMRSGLDASLTSPDVTADANGDTGIDVMIVVLTRDDEADLATTLDAIRTQTLENWQCVIIDDGSVDGTVAAAWTYAGADDRFDLIRHKMCSGRAALLNTASRVAECELIFFCDPGDVLRPNAIESLVRAAYQEDRSYVMAWSSGLEGVISPSDSASSRGGVIDFLSLHPGTHVGISGILIDAATLMSMGGFDESLVSHAADWSLIIDFLRAGNCISVAHADIFDSRRRTAGKHDVGVLVSEIEQVRASLRSESAGTEFPFSHDSYEATGASAGVVISSALGHLLDGDGQAASDTLKGINKVDRGWIARRIDLHGAAAAEVASRYGTSIDVAGELAGEAGLVERLNDLMVDHDPPVSRVARPHPVPIDFLFAPENASQAVAMRRTTADLLDSGVVFVITDAISGDQGASSVLASNKEAILSYSELLSSQRPIKTLVVSFPRSGAIEELIRVAHDAGAAVVELADDTAAVMRVPESYETPVELQQARNASELVAIAQRTLSSVQLKPTHPGGWNGDRSPDPDSVFQIEEYPQTSFDGLAITRFRDLHRGERCVIIGNGPSLNDLDLTLLAGEHTIGVNGLFYARERMGFDPTYYVVEDTAVVNDNLEQIKAYRAGHKFFPSIYRSRIGEAPDISYFMMNRGYYEKRSSSFCVPRFSIDAAQRLYTGQSVTAINLQLAYYMGFAEVILIGMDFSYVIPADAERDGDNITSVGDDPNHFHPDYFGRGKVWKDPKLDRVLANYQLAKLMYDADGRRIVNGTPGGKLEMFDRVDYETVIMSQPVGSE